MSIRLRLTVLYTAILALTLVGLGGVLYGTQYRSLRQAESRVLAMTAQRLVERIESGEPLPPEFRPQPMPGHDDQGPPRRFGLPAAYWQIYSIDGKPQLRSYELEDVEIPLGARALAAALRGDTWSGSLRLGADRLFLVTAPVVSNGRVSQVLAVAHSITAQHDYLATLRRNLLVGGGVVLLLAFACGWLMSGIVLRPVDQITHTAKEIGAHRDFARRVQHIGPNDEIGALATTFNGMLGELEAAYRQQQQFVADVSHELRTPLTTLRGNIELLRRDPPVSEDDRAEALSDMTSESQRLIRLVNDLLRLARADARQPLRPEVVRVEPLIEDVCRQARVLDPERSIACPSLPAVDVMADRDGLKQALLALVDNAVKYTSGPIAVAATVHGDEVRFAVKDLGPGIPNGELDRVFERFYRGQPSHTRPEAGLGLGLPIAKALIEAQGGRIEVVSEPAEGSTFVITLPVAGMARSAGTGSSPQTTDR